MFSKVLIANRGEIACRIIRTARRMGIRTVAVYSDADRDALHVALADEAVHIGAPASQQSYLRGERIIAAARQTGAQAIHPGYGFLSENAGFARACAENDVVFIGPPIGAIEAMGSKSAAKTIMQEAGVPLVPGYHGKDQDISKLRDAANEMGYPVLLKAVAGGGGKGMRQVWSADEFDGALTQAKSEALASFDNDDMLVEKYLTQPRHVEVQVFCDQHTNAVYLFERDCSVQRRHQKIIEEAPAPGFNTALRTQIGKAAIKAALAIDYVGAGTVEFLFDTDGSFYFMEMNTRLQVEHPVTEMITGEDLVEWQLRVANGESLPKTQEQLSINGHAFEARIYAEDPGNDFLPTAGTLHHLQTPAEDAHVRVDTGVLQGDIVSPFYDPMIAKLIVHDENRDRALARLAKALTEYQISGVTTNIEFLYTLATNPAFAAAELDTGFIGKHHDELFDAPELQAHKVLPLACLYLLQRNRGGRAPGPASPWQQPSGWRLNQPAALHCEIVLHDQHWRIPVRETDSVTAGRREQTNYELVIDGQSVAVGGSFDGQRLHAEIDGHQQRISVVDHGDHITLFTASGAVDFALPDVDLGLANEAASGGDFRAPMNGTIIEVSASNGQSVKAGDTLVIMEAMKMQHTISAPADGVVEEVFCATGELIDGGAELLRFAASDLNS